jgi:hypothetical protein
MTEQGLMQLSELVRLKELDLDKCSGLPYGAKAQFWAAVRQQKLSIRDVVDMGRCCHFRRL